jgi:hypothetical protein
MEGIKDVTLDHLLVECSPDPDPPAAGVGVGVVVGGGGRGCNIFSKNFTNGKRLTIVPLVLDGELGNGK